MPPCGAHSTPGTQEQPGNRSVYQVLVDFGTDQIWGDLEVGDVYCLYEHVSNRSLGKGRMMLSGSTTEGKNGNARVTAA